MNIVEVVDELVAIERDVRRIEMLIEYIGSLSEEDLAKAWPRICALRKTQGSTLIPQRYWTNCSQSSRDIVTLPVNDLVVERFQLAAEKLQQLSLHHD